MKPAFLAAAVLVWTIPALAQDANDGSMSGVVDGFYRAYESFRPPDGIPDATERNRLEPYVSIALNRLLTDVQTAEDRYEKLTKGQFPPLIEGDPFTPNFDGATSYSIGPCERDARGGQCRVSLTFAGGKEQPRSWTDTVMLVHTESGWRVNDIEYGDIGGSGRGSLDETLKNAIEHGEAAK